MFDNVGVDPDRESKRRRFVALLGTSSLVTLVAGSGALYLAILASWYVNAPAEPAVDLEMVEVELPEVEILQAPAPPPPPIALGRPDAPETPKIPDEPQEVTAPLPEVVAEAVADSTIPKGDPKGIPDGDPEGEPEGVPGGEKGGQKDGTPGGEGYRTFHHSEVEVKRKVMPSYPEAAKSMNLGDVDCKVRVFIDEAGLPSDVVVESCPRVFEASLRETMKQWRWYPAKVDGQKVKAQFLLNVKYKLS